MAAFALAICSRRAADDFFCVWPGSAESAVIPVLPDATEALDGIVPSQDVTDEPRETRDAFLGASPPSLDCDGFLNKPLTEGRLVGGRGARVFEVDLGIETSGSRFPGLGVLVRGAAIALGGGIPYMDVRPCFDGVALTDGD